MALMDRPEMMDVEQAPPSPLLEGDALKPGMVNEAEGALPDEGVASMEDDVPATAQEGDFILPYETILYVGYENINEMVRQAATEAQADGVPLEGVDTEAEVPIQISNYEYRIPAALVPFIGMDVLEDLQAKGLEFREQLSSVRDGNFMERPTGDVEGLGDAMPEEEMPMPEQALAMPQEAPAMPMMKGGGYVPMQGVGNVDNPGFNNPLQPPTKTMEKQTLDMRGGGLVKKKLNEGGILKFNPEGSDYDIKTAKKFGLQPYEGEGPDKGHMGSVVPATKKQEEEHNLPLGSYLMLKGTNHPTWYKAVEAEKYRGYDIIKRGNRYWSVPIKFQGM